MRRRDTRQLKQDVPHVNRLAGQSRATRLVINADDFGYFDQVSRGIVEAAERGIVTATGVMANGPALPRWIDKLKALASVSVGVHLNATLGYPLTSQMRSKLASSDGQFSSKGALVSSLLLGRVPVPVLLQEWRAQIQHCRQAGLHLEFINSHEHIHMLPILYPKVCELADEFGIAHVRAPRAEWSAPATRGSWARNGVFAMARFLTPPPSASEPILIGSAPSGRLNSAYCSWRFPRLGKGGAYELMCHPGWNDTAACNDPKLAAYHDWEGELEALLSPAFLRLLRENEIVLTSYSHLGEAE